jgi:serine/threonine protein phosphatase PrpC
MFKRRLHCNYFIDSEQGGRKYMEDFLLSSENDCAKLYGKSVYNHRLLVDCETTVFGVFDGHGGPEAAKFAQCNLLNEIMKQPGINSSDDQLVMKAIEAGFTSTSVKMWNDLGNDSYYKSACIMCN